MSRNRQLSIVGALLLTIGFAVGALSMAIMRPPIRIVQDQPAAKPINQPQAHPQPEPPPAIEPALQPRQFTKADPNGTPPAIVAFIRERLEKNTASGQFEEIEWKHHVGTIPDGRISNLWLPIAVGGHGATLEFRSFDGRRWSRGWIAAAQYGPDHFDWGGEFDGQRFLPEYSIPSDKPVMRNPAERAAQMFDEFLDERLPPGPAPQGSQSMQSSSPAKR